MARVSKKAKAPEAVHPAVTRIYKTAIYTRLSDEDIRKKISDSLGTQKAMLLNYLQEHKDLQLYDVYEDVNYTGTNFARPAFARMIADIQADRVDCVLVKDLSRFGRSFEEMGHYLERVFPFLQVRFISVGDNYDSLTASLDESSLIVPLKNLMNEVYARDISRKVQSSVKMRQKRGQFVGPIVPYGYLKHGQSFIVDNEAAAIVRQIFQWILDGNSDIAITQKLNGQKIPPPSRYRFEKGLTKSPRCADIRFWGKTTIKTISENPVYIGVMAQGRRKSNFLHGGGIIKTDSEDWIVVEDTHPAIIDKATFGAVQKLRANRRENYKVRENHAPQNNIFKGLIVCGGCKKPMMRSRLRRAQGDEYFFQCSVYEQVDKNACTKKKVMEADIRGALYATIRREISFAVDLGRVMAELQKRDSFQSQTETLDKKIAALQKKLGQNRRFRGSLREDYIDGVLSEKDYALMKAAYDEEKYRLDQEIDALLATRGRQNNTPSPENKWITGFRQFETERYLSPQMLSALVERIEVFDSERISVYLCYRDEFEALREYMDGFMPEARAVNE